MSSSDPTDKVPEEPTPEGDWIWEALPEEDVVPASNSTDATSDVVNPKPIILKKLSSDKALGNRKSSFGGLKITSSPSFQELEKAIGATLNMSSTDSGDLAESRRGSPKSPPQAHFSKSKYSGTDLTQQKLNQQRHRQAQQNNQRNALYNNHYNSNANRQGNVFYAQPARATPVSTGTGELTQFLQESESRALLLFHSPQLPQALIRHACSNIGDLYYLLHDFHDRGVTLLAYMDLRTANVAKSSLIKELGPNAEASIHYSLTLIHNNIDVDECCLILGNLPGSYEQSAVRSVFEKYGHLRSVQKTLVEAHKTETETETEDSQKAAPVSLTETGKALFAVEFYNITDSRAALSSLSESPDELLGPEATLSFAQFHSMQFCRQMQSILSRWRSESSANRAAVPLSPPMMSMGGGMGMNFTPMQLGMMPDPANPHVSMGMGQPSGYTAMPMAIPIVPMAGAMVGGMEMQYFEPQPQQMQHFQPFPLSPQHNVIPMQPYYGQFNPQMQFDPSMMAAAQHNMRQMHAANFDRAHFMSQGPTYQPAHRMNQVRAWNKMDFNHTSDSESINSRTSQHYNNKKYYDPSHGANSNRFNRSHQQMNSPPSHHNGAHDGRSQQYFMPATLPLGGPGYRANWATAMAAPQNSKDLIAEGGYLLDPLKIGQDNRTTIMVRNIPNKYNQQMLLEEVNAHHIGSYDFFYLPIDFKNHCNVGYCFINFIDPQYIIAFVNDFNGKKWKNFNSEKICAVSFARIQGKQAMIARFQNSSLLEKDDEYRPLLFHSSGPEIGKPEPFPTQKIIYSHLQLPNVPHHTPASFVNNDLQVDPVLSSSEGLNNSSSEANTLTTNSPSPNSVSPAINEATVTTNP